MGTLIDVKSVSQAKEESCHFIPCEIQFDGNANIDNFFLTTVSKKESNEKEFQSTFRGRPLEGEEIQVPSGYRGLIVNEPHARATEDENRQMVVTHTFDKFIHWNLDKQPSEDDPVQRAFQWMDISEAIHRPITSIQKNQD